MYRFYIRDICRILDVKAHVIRYWEKEVPFLVPRKNISGTRVYTFHEISLFFRLKYIVYTKKLPLSKAAGKLWEEMTCEDQELRLRIQTLREKLLILYSSSKGQQKLLEKFFDDKDKSDDIG
ncbi:MAG: hypothetical protein DRP59_11085, partial [Spirochaetes bacterium]